MSDFRKRKRVSEENFEEIVNTSEGSEFSDNGSYDSDIPSENINSSIFYESEDDCSDAEETVSDIQHSTWTHEGTERPRFPFIGKPGLNVKVENSENPLEFFQLFITPKIADLISRETNRYAQQFLEKNPPHKEKSRLHHWKDTNGDEIMILLAFFLLQGLHQKRDNKSYFARRKVLETPIFLELFTERRFYLLLKFLHFVDNEAYDENTCGSRRLYKLKPIVDHLNETFRTVYTPKCDVSVDESLMMWKDHLAWKEYLSTKHARLDIKLFKLYEAESGYVWNFVVYVGKETVFQENLEDETYYESKVVLELMAPLLNQGYCVTMDNRFSSPDLFEKLSNQNTDAVGSLHLKRKGVPSEIKKAKLKKGEYICMYKDKLFVIKWKDRKDMCLMSTTHDEAVIEKECRGQRVNKPKVAIDYNKTMSGDNLSDAYIFSYWSARHGLQKYYVKYFRHMIDICCVNSYLLYKKMGGKISQMEFQMRLIENMILQYQSNEVRPTVRPAKSAPPTRINASHYPSFIPPTEKKYNPCRRCIVCYKSGERRETRYTCGDCNVALCPAPCFLYYHTLVDY